MPLQLALSKDQRLEADLNHRLGELSIDVYEMNGDLGLDFHQLSAVVRLLRAAYGRGYMDALREDVHARLCRDHGFPVPASRRDAVNRLMAMAGSHPAVTGVGSAFLMVAGMRLIDVIGGKLSMATA